jgi:adenine-specific DNA-methyltransferase
MKYMGSKRWMLSNGLGSLLAEQAPRSERFVDLFSGSAAVSWHVAQNARVPVLAVDLQEYSAVLGQAVLGRTKAVSPSRVLDSWLGRAQAHLDADPAAEKASALARRKVSRTAVTTARRLCGEHENPIVRAYGGHYFSPTQALAVAALRSTVAEGEPERSIALASLIWAATRCVAAPGHTAQPFQPTLTAVPFIAESWAKDVLAAVREVLPTIATLKARVQGQAMVGDAIQIAERHVKSGDLVFLDPPYSAAQYSRFYHVLETIAQGSCGPVSGIGRYPAGEHRPKSLFSLKTQAPLALNALIQTLRETDCRVVMTLPQHACSNGLVGEEIVAMARDLYEVDVTAVALRHSTLGGNNSHRVSRRTNRELILYMRPRRTAPASRRRP